jgi:hypothetical protein
MEELRSSFKDYCNYLRMSEDNVMSLLEKVRPLIEKEDTVLRTAITAEERLAITMHFLVTGRSFYIYIFCNNFFTGAWQNSSRNVQSHLLNTQEIVAIFTH